MIESEQRIGEPGDPLSLLGQHSNQHIVGVLEYATYPIRQGLVDHEKRSTIVRWADRSSRRQESLSLDQCHHSRVGAMTSTESISPHREMLRSPTDPRTCSPICFLGHCSRAGHWPAGRTTWSSSLIHRNARLGSCGCYAPVSRDRVMSGPRRRNWY